MQRLLLSKQIDLYWWKMVFNYDATSFNNVVTAKV